MQQKNVEQSTVIIYTVTSADSTRFGWARKFCLWDCTDNQEMVWAEPHTYKIPEGFEVSENAYGSLMFFGPDGKGAELVNDGYGRPALAPSTMRHPNDYVRLQEVDEAAQDTEQSR